MKYYVHSTLAILIIFLSVTTSCKKEEVTPEEDPVDSTSTTPPEVILAEISSSEIVDIKKDIATCKFSIKRGNTEITRVGVCWSKDNSSPETNDNLAYAELSSQDSEVEVELNNLSIDTGHYARAFIKQEGNTYYSDVMYFEAGKFFEFGSGAQDGSGNIYTTLIIGEQEWFASNLKSSKFIDGSNIQEERTMTTWGWEANATPFYYGNSKGNLYNHGAVRGSKKLCPNGWRVPSKSDWDALISYVDPKADIDELRQTEEAGAKLNEDYSFNLTYPGYISGAGGGKYETGSSPVGFWTTTVKSTSEKTYYSRIFYKNSGLVVSGYNSERNGFCIRCLKN